MPFVPFLQSPTGSISCCIPCLSSTLFFTMPTLLFHVSDSILLSVSASPFHVLNCFASVPPAYLPIGLAVLVSPSEMLPSPKSFYARPLTLLPNPYTVVLHLICCYPVFLYAFAAFCKLCSILSNLFSSSSPAPCHFPWSLPPPLTLPRGPEWDSETDQRCALLTSVYYLGIAVKTCEVILSSDSKTIRLKTDNCSLNFCGS